MARRLGTSGRAPARFPLQGSESKAMSALARGPNRRGPTMRTDEINQEVSSAIQLAARAPPSTTASRLE